MADTPEPTIVFEDEIPSPTRGYFTLRFYGLFPELQKQIEELLKALKEKCPAMGEGEVGPYELKYSQTYSCLEIYFSPNEVCPVAATSSAFHHLIALTTETFTRDGVNYAYLPLGTRLSEV